MSEQWIVIPNWDSFQHYKNRQPIWIKVYTELLENPDYRSLGGFHRGLLHDIWMLYALSRGELPASPSRLAVRLGFPTEADDRKRREAGDSMATGWRFGGDSVAIQSPDSETRPVRMRDLKRLEQAGFLTITASRPSDGASTAATAEVEKSKNPPTPKVSRKNGTSPRQRGTNPRAEPTPSFVCGIEGCTGAYPTQRALDDHRELAHIPVHANGRVDHERAPIDPGQEPDPAELENPDQPNWVG
jgi:hypothetical protein